MHAAAVRVNLHRLFHQAVRNGVRQLAAHTGGVDAADHAIADMLDQRRVAGHQRTGGQRQVFKPQTSQRIHHMVNHLVAFTEGVVERNGHAVLQTAFANGLFKIGTQLALVFFGDVIQPGGTVVGIDERLQRAFFRIVLLQCFNKITHDPILSLRRPAGATSRRRPVRKLSVTRSAPIGVRRTPARAPPPGGRGR